MLFLQRQSLLCVCIILMQFYACLVVSAPANDHFAGVSSVCAVTKIPFKISVEMKPFDKNLYQKPYKMFDPEQCYTRRAALWCVQLNTSAEACIHKPPCSTIVPFENKKITIPLSLSSFAAIRHIVCQGVSHYYLQDDDYDKLHGYWYVLTGHYMVNEHLSESSKKPLPEPYYTKRAKYWLR